MKHSNRRDFFKLTALATGGFMLQAQAQSASPEAFNLNPFIKITSKGEISIVSHIPEVGQGVKTSLPMIIAEELEVDWEQVRVITDIANTKAYGKPLAGGSQSTARNYSRFRELGAAARQTLIQAAASKWSVPVAECVALSGEVHHPDTKQTLGYGELAADASQLKAPHPKDFTLKNPKDFKLLGKRIPGVDNEAIVKGQPLFGIDQVQPGMKYAAFLRCPTFVGEVKSANLDEVKKMPGVSDAFILKNAPFGRGGVFAGVAVIADSTWNAWKAKDALKVEWDGRKTDEHDTVEYEKKATRALDNVGKGKGKKKGRPASKDARSLEATYSFPLLAHNTLEPQNCTALYENGKMEIWAPTQDAQSAIDMVSALQKVKPENIKFHVTRSGGGFGRRINSDFVAEVAAIAKRAEGTPIKLTWTREQDIKQDFYRAAGWHRDPWPNGGARLQRPTWARPRSGHAGSSSRGGRWCRTGLVGCPTA